MRGVTQLSLKGVFKWRMIELSNERGTLKRMLQNRLDSWKGDVTALRNLVLNESFKLVSIYQESQLNVSTFLNWEFHDHNSGFPIVAEAPPPRPPPNPLLKNEAHSRK